MATIEQNLTQLVQDRDDLVTNLTTKGITGLTGDETFTELVPEVLNIPSGSGHDWSAIGYSGEPQVIQDGYDYAKTIYDNWDSSVTSMLSMFSGNKQLYYMPLVDTSNVTNMRLAFSSSNLTTIPQLDTSSVNRMDNTFGNCYFLTTIPQLDTSNVTNMEGMFTFNYSIKSSLKSIPQLDASKVEDIYQFFSGSSICFDLLTDFGGFKDLGKAYLTTTSANYLYYTLSLSSATKLTHDSLMNVINNLWDIATAGVQTQKLVLGSTNLAKLSADEIAIATNKGWAVS